MSEDTTTIQISVENYKRLSGKKNPGDTFDDVVGRVLDEHERLHKGLEPSEQDPVSTDELDTTAQQNQATNRSAEITETVSANESVSNAVNESKNSRQMALSSNSRLDNDIEQAILELDLSTSASRKKWIPAIREAHRYLKEHEQASKQDFIHDVFPEESAGYDNDRTWWRKVVRPGLTALPGVEKPDAGGEWTYTGVGE